jgi:hypothetical protein
MAAITADWPILSCDKRLIKLNLIQKMNDNYSYYLIHYLKSNAKTKAFAKIKRLEIQPFYLNYSEPYNLKN